MKLPWQKPTDELVKTLLVTVNEVYDKLKSMASQASTNHVYGERIKLELSDTKYNNSLIGGIEELTVPYNASLNFKNSGKIETKSFDPQQLLTSMKDYKAKVTNELNAMSTRFGAIVNELQKIKQKTQPRSSSLDIVVENASESVEYDISPSALYRDLQDMAVLMHVFAKGGNTYAGELNKYLQSKLKELRPLSKIEKYHGTIENKTVGQTLDRES